MSKESRSQSRRSPATGAKRRPAGADANGCAVPNAGNHKPLRDPQVHAVADLFGVLSEPTRLRILQFLQAGPASVGEIVAQLGLKQANASKQLSILQTAGVLSREQQGNRAIYAIAMPLVFDLCNLVCDRIAEHAQERAAATSAIDVSGPRDTAVSKIMHHRRNPSTVIPNGAVAT